MTTIRNFDIDEISGIKIVHLEFTDVLQRADYEEFVPQLEWMINNGDRIRLLIRLSGFRGWSAGALWEDTKFAANHFNHIERIAVVGEKTWEKGLTYFMKPFTGAAVRFFERTDDESAEAWIRADSRNSEGA